MLSTTSASVGCASIGFRVVKNFNNKFWLGASVENAQTTNLGGGNFPNNFVIGAPGTGGGLYNSGETLTAAEGCHRLLITPITTRRISS